MTSLPRPRSASDNYNDATGGPVTGPFDDIKHVDADGEFWLGRELQPLMQYGTWGKFAEVLAKAKASLTLVEGDVAANRHFATWGSDGGRWGNQRLDDVRLTRFGAYLTAMAGDDTKEAIAYARVYFAVKTREAEVMQEQRSLPRSYAQALRDLASEVEAREVAENALAVAAPKAAIADQFLGDGELMYLDELAKTLKLTRHRLTTILRDEQVLYANEMLYRKGYEDWFEVVQDWVPHLGKYMPALKATRAGVQGIYELLVGNEWISSAGQDVERVAGQRPWSRSDTRGPGNTRP